MSDILAASRSAFLAEVQHRVSKRYQGVDFSGILDRLIQWSRQPRRGLEVRKPGKEHTVSFGLARPPHPDIVLWKAEPLNNHGAKIVVLSKSFKLLPEVERTELLRHLREVAPSVRVAAKGALQMPMHLLAADRALDAFTSLLDAALESARKYRGNAV